MTKVKIFVVALCTTFFSFLNVNTLEGKESKSPFEPFNIIVILDTSNRISKEKHPGQMERDIKIVKEIINQFNEVVKKHIERSDRLEYDSRLEIVIPDQPSAPTIPLEITEKLIIKDQRGHTSIAGIHKDLENQTKVLLDAMSKLYEFVEKKIVEEHKKQTGSDIWKWFQDQARDHLLVDHQNLIICISDGYLDFDKYIEKNRSTDTYMQVEELRNDLNWKDNIVHLSPITGNFSNYNVKFLMLEIVLRRDKDGAPYQKDFDIIREYWKTWLKSMSIESPDFIERGPHPGRKIESYFK